MSKKTIVMLTERRAASNGPGEEREIIEHVGIPVSRIRKSKPVFITDWSKRADSGDYPVIEVTQLQLGSPEDYIVVMETGAQIADLVNGDIDPPINILCRATRHPGTSPRPTHICREPRGHDGDHVWAELTL